MRPRWIKICGMRRAPDAELAVALGATHLGCVLAPDSPRRATFGEVQRLRAAVAGAVQLVLVFRGAREPEILHAVAATGVPFVQPHGADEALSAELERRGLQVLRVHRVGSTLPVPEPAPSADRPALFDGGRGGDGQRFPWQLLGTQAPAHVFVAGGICADNAAELLRHRPFGIDIGSGTESAPGHKDQGRMRALFACLLETAHE
jgi:indole-3-glycerol phosphate synthase/phosphoribosylanthranilate isomerase